MRTLFKIPAGLVAAYLLISAALLAIMRQPPVRFAKAIAKLPGPMFMLFPFETLWTFARGGRIRPGDPAPEFDLQTLDKTARVQLRSFQGRMPVVLIFGSYT
ncbi:MAG: hypothetical protein ABSF64_24415 [Bryobacteraceae bacterium]|jgi:hypothetical protein